MHTELTEISKNNLSYLHNKDITPKEIIGFLNEGALFRTFTGVLSHVCPNADLSARLTEGLHKLTGDNRENIARKVRNWLNGKNTPQNREQLFQICFVLGLDEKNSDTVLAAASDTGIHYRNPSELVYAYALRTGLDYAEALKLKSKILSELKFDSANEEITHFTKQIKNAFSDVKNDEELFSFFEEYGNALGYIHETAYLKFLELMSFLTAPDSGIEDVFEKDYSLERVAEEYLRMKMPLNKKTAGLTLLQKAVKKNWPNESDLQNIRNRKADVSRKAMILLYLVTEEYDADFDESEYFLYEADDDDPDERLEVRLKKMNLFLDEYGMNKLDLGNPFDCLVLYAMKTQYDEFSSDKISEAIEVLYNTTD